MRLSKKSLGESIDKLLTDSDPNEVANRLFGLSDIIADRFDKFLNKYNSCPFCKKYAPLKSWSSGACPNCGKQVLDPKVKCYDKERVRKIS